MVQGVPPYCTIKFQPHCISHDLLVRVNGLKQITNEFLLVFKIRKYTVHIVFLFLLQELIDKAKGQAARGLKMIEQNECNRESIKLKCDEIRQLCDQFDKSIQKREEDLRKAMDIHECLEMVQLLLE